MAAEEYKDYKIELSARFKSGRWHGNAKVAIPGSGTITFSTEQPDHPGWISREQAEAEVMKLAKLWLDLKPA